MTEQIESVKLIKFATEVVNETKSKDLVVYLENFIVKKFSQRECKFSKTKRNNQQYGKYVNTWHMRMFLTISKNKQQ